jgi:hypothetical protein
MFGNLATNTQIVNLEKSGYLIIEPFERSSLKAMSYTLNPGRVLRRSPDGEWEVSHAFSKGRPKCKLDPGEYVIVEPRQVVKIKAEGLVGRFVATSTNVEDGLFVLAGQIDSQYGMRGEALRFGVKNLFDVPTYITNITRLVHMEVFDSRGSSSEPLDRPNDNKIWQARVRDPKWERDDSDGPLPIGA